MSESTGGLSRELVERLKKRDQAAWRKVYEKYSRLADVLSRRMAHGRDEVAEDIYQQIWLEAILKIDNYQADTPFILWMMRNAENYYRRCNYRTMRALPSLHEIPDSPHDSDLDDAIRRAAIVDAKLSLLRKKDRLVIELYYFERLDLDEVAARLRVRVDTARKWLTRARERFRKLLEPDREQLLAPPPQRCLLSSDTVRHA